MKMLDHLMWFGITLIVGLVLTFIIVAVIRRMLKKTKLEPLLQNFVVSASRVTGILLTLILALEQVGVNPSSFLTVMGVTGAAIALAVKDTLSNVAGGLMIIASHPFRQGDYIEVDGKSGYVDRIDIMRTMLKTYENREIEIPNSIINGSILMNYTARDIRRVDLDVHVEQGSDLRKIEDLLMAVAESSPFVIDEPEPFFGVRDAKNGYIGIDFFVWCRTEEYWDTYYFLQENAELALDEAGIRTPGQKIDVNMNKK